jgi:hypothetical protein
VPLRAPADEYADRKAARELVVAHLTRTHVQIGNAKVAIFLIALVAGAITLGGDQNGTVWVAGLACYLGLWVWHEVTLRALARAEAAVTFYADGLSRIGDRWTRVGYDGARFRDGDHPYADDLDVFGPGSLFQLLSGARTPMGEERLAAWLSTAAEPSAIRERQARVVALRSQIDLRERIAVVNAGSHRPLVPDRLMAWAEAPPAVPRSSRPLVALLGLAFAAAVGVALAGGTAWPLVVVPAVNLLLIWRWMAPATTVVEGLSSATESAGLDLLARVIAEIEDESFADPALAALAARLKGAAAGDSASRGIARLARVSDWVDSRHNAFARLLEIPMLFTLQVAHAAEAWKARDGARLRAWVDVVGEIEALLSLAGYSFEHPADPFPEIIESSDGAAVYDAVGVAHPLLPASTAVPNTVSLGLQARVLIVSGSNMAGKSTLMRTIGLNAVLALAGAPVRAASLRLTPLALGTCLRHTDSLREGRSGFFTEVLRIRQVCELLDGPRRVLFLFDELLSGTNSKDRRTAAEGLVRMLIARRAIGLVTTHDLALTEMAALMPAEVRNVHLQDHVEDGQMRFDYKLRDGVIAQSNALELMRMIGLDV